MKIAMRKCSAISLLIVVCLLLTTVAGAEEAMTPVVIEEIDMALSLPSQMLLMNKEEIEAAVDTEELAEIMAVLGVEGAEDFMSFHLQFMDEIVHENDDIFIGIVAVADLAAAGMEDAVLDFEDMKTEDLELMCSIYQAVFNEISEEGVSFQAELYENEQTPYIVIEITAQEDGATLQMVMYMAFHNQKVYAVEFIADNTRSRDRMETIMDTVRLEQSTYSPSGFRDMKGHWAEDAVIKAVELELFSGTGDKKFDPDGGMTRAMLVQVLYRLEGKPEAEASKFTDVTADAWYADAVAWASANGIVKGSGGKFNPEGLLTREQMAAILYRYQTYSGGAVELSENAGLDAYADAANVSAWAADAMTWAVDQGLIKGLGFGKLAPQNTTTRAQVATILVRSLEE